MVVLSPVVGQYAASIVRICLVLMSLFVSRPLTPLTREQMGKFAEADQLFRVLKMRHWFRCLQCRHQNQPSDGVWGVGDSSASEFIVQCSCTKRVYAGGGAAMPVH